MKLLVLAAAAAVALAMGCAKEEKEAAVADVSTVILTGKVVYYSPDATIGGESDPAGFVLEGEFADELRPRLQAAGLVPAEGTLHLDRLYLADGGSLEAPAIAAFDGKLVRVIGVLMVVQAGGVETPARTFPVLEVETIEGMPEASHELAYRACTPPARENPRRNRGRGA